MNSGLDIIFDIETDGLLPDVTKVHCLGMTVEGALAGQVFANQEPYDCLEEALEIMSRANSLCGHNIIGYDLPVLKKVLGWTPPKHVKIIDTMILSRLIHTNMYEEDIKQRTIPLKLYGRHSLEAWGERLGVKKASLGGDEDDVH
jgi:hypothetical protein